MLFNGDMIKRATAAGKGTLINYLLSNTRMNDRDKINYLFKAGLARNATKHELQLARQIYAGRNGNAQEALQDLWWVILNSNEFIFNH